MTRPDTAVSTKALWLLTSRASALIWSYFSAACARDRGLTLLFFLDDGSSTSLRFEFGVSTRPHLPGTEVIRDSAGLDEASTAILPGRVAEICGA